MKWRQHFADGIWHVHTSLTDGKNTVTEYCEAIAKKNIPLVCFTEHVALNLTYDFNVYVAEIKQMRERFPDMTILCGIEVGLRNGTLQASEEVLKQADVVFGALHSATFPSSRVYMTALEQLLKSRIDVWAHPMVAFEEAGRWVEEPTVKVAGGHLSDDDLNHILDLLVENQITVEHNLKWRVPNIQFLRYCIDREVPLLIGQDAHAVYELKGVWKCPNCQGHGWIPLKNYKYPHTETDGARCHICKGKGGMKFESVSA